MKSSSYKSANLFSKKSLHDKAVGIWQLEKSFPHESESNNEINDTYTFKYHENNMVTLRLLTLNKNQWKSEDDFYKLSAKWDQNILYYMPPFGSWTKLAVFENEEFIIVGNGIKRIFKLISDEEVVDWNVSILKHRELHDYSIKANQIEN